MIRRYTNISGSPEIKIRRQSPVIGGARIYPGLTIEFNDAEWVALDDMSKKQLESFVMLDPPVFSYEESGELVVSTVEDSRFEVEYLPDESEIEDDVGTEDGESKSIKLTPHELDVEDSESEDEDIEILGEPAVNVVKDGEFEDEELPDKLEFKDEARNESDADTVPVAVSSKKSVPAPDEFDSSSSSNLFGKEPEDEELDCDGFLNQSIKNIKEAYLLQSFDQPDIENLIVAEKASQNRSSLIGWLKQQLN